VRPDDADADSDADTDTDADSDADAVAGIDDLRRGDLVITEIMRDPLAVADVDGEWFEVWNASDTTVDLRGLAVSDDGGDAFAVGGRLRVEARDYVVFGVSSSTSANGGVTVDWTYAWANLALANGADELILSNASGTIDEVAWDDTFPADEGAAMQLAPEREDASSNDAGRSWCSAQTPLRDGDLGTPGEANDPC
jgi:hypothetical protein